MTRINERIRAPRVRVVLPDGQQLGIMTPMEALQKAKLVGLDLVEIAAKADPPVCRIIDYGKYKYEQAKLQKQQKTSKNATRMKEIKFRVRTEQHDYNIKLGRIETFLDEGHKVRVVLQYRGRENAHKELGFDKLNRIIGDLKTMANVDQEPRLSGRAVGMLLSPLPKAQRQRKFHLYHGELIDEDEFAADEDDEDEDVEFVAADEDDDDEASDSDDGKTADKEVDPFKV
ncbi:translation initiation factor IF-3 [Haloferula sp.]|uniref:translation initiation factor IF-3 n=1 Tax=Haloferula sp. TaxID=2497595 RepID=UPI003C71E098